jgi:hypothetical protein
MKSKITKWLLKWLCRKLVSQGPNHESNITEYYRVIWKAARKEFREDNDPTLQKFMKECHERSMHSTLKRSMEYTVEYPEEKHISFR